MRVMRRDERTAAFVYLRKAEFYARLAEFALRDAEQPTKELSEHIERLSTYGNWIRDTKTSD